MLSSVTSIINGPMSWFINILDILIITIIFFVIIRLVKDSKAMQLFKSLIAFSILYLVSYLLDMQGCQFLFKIIFDNIFIILIVIFAPEIRGVLEGFGRKNTLKNQISFLFNIKKEKNRETIEAISEICHACKNMSRTKTGALIIFEQGTNLGNIIDTGKVIEGKITSELVENIFFHNSPLHDGAMIIRDNKMQAAGCILPVSNNQTIKSKYGTRHRAAIGISEQSDCISVIVSEETGHISVAMNGKLFSDLSETELKEILLSGEVNANEE